jgi:DNA-binding MarR family transcriptional regulator
MNEIGIIGQLSATEFNRRMPEGLHISHFSVINHLCRLGDGRTPVALARAFQVTKATMTNTLMRLSERKFINIGPNPEDGRSKLVFLTAKGRAFQIRAIAALEPALELAAEHLELEKIVQILPALQELRIFFDENRSK